MYQSHIKEYKEKKMLKHVHTCNQHETYVRHTLVVFDMYQTWWQAYRLELQCPQWNNTGANSSQCVGCLLLVRFKENWGDTILDIWMVWSIHLQSVAKETSVFAIWPIELQFESLQISTRQFEDNIIIITLLPNRTQLFFQPLSLPLIIFGTKQAQNNWEPQQEQ